MEDNRIAALRRNMVGCSISFPYIKDIAGCPVKGRILSVSPEPGPDENGDAVTAEIMLSSLTAGPWPETGINDGDVSDYDDKTREFFFIYGKNIKDRKLTLPKRSFRIDEGGFGALWLQTVADSAVTAKHHGAAFSEIWLQEASDNGKALAFISGEGISPVNIHDSAIIAPVITVDIKNLGNDNGELYLKENMNLFPDIA